MKRNIFLLDLCHIPIYIPEEEYRNIKKNCAVGYNSRIREFAMFTTQKSAKRRTSIIEQDICFKSVTTIDPAKILQNSLFFLHKGFFCVARGPQLIK